MNAFVKISPNIPQLPLPVYNSLIQLDKRYTILLNGSDGTSIVTQKALYEAYAKNVTIYYDEEDDNGINLGKWPFVLPIFPEDPFDPVELDEARETSFDRVAVLYVSVTILHHYRSDTTVQHYLIK